jgi:hypothetical protein
MVVDSTRTTPSANCNCNWTFLPIHRLFHKRHHPSMPNRRSSSSKRGIRTSRHLWKRQRLLRHLRLPLLPRSIRPFFKTWSGAVRQNGGASRAQYSRSLATSVAVERSPVVRQPIPVVVIEHASTFPSAFQLFSLKTLFLCDLCIFSSVLKLTQPTTTFPTPSIFLFCCSLGAYFLGICHHCSPLILFYFSFIFLIPSLCALVLMNSTLILFSFFWYGTGPVRDDNSSASTLPSPIVAADPLGQKRPHL